jgi:hypothetical protein
LVVGVLYAVSEGHRGLQAQPRAAPEIVAAQRAASERSLPSGATGSSRITNDTERVGGSLYRYASLPFEIASVLLLVAIIGSVMLARTLRQEASADDVDPETLQEAIALDPELAKVEPRSE